MDEIHEWAASGAMALTGRRGGPPLVAPGTPASSVRGGLDKIAAATRQRTATTPQLPGVQLLSERAAIAGFSRKGPWSCGGAFRAVPTVDGWLGLSIARPADLEMLPALTGSAVDREPWEAISRWSRALSSREAAERVAVLGMAGCPLPPPRAADVRPGVVTTDGGTRSMLGQPRILDLTSLWAGPLCAHLLGLCGASVTKVESSRRPDGARFGLPAFFDLLHEGHASVVVDFETPSGRARLQQLIEQSDLVLEASRPRAMRQLGIVAEDYVSAGISWLSITARGREHNSVGFGDDVAAGAGIFIVDGEEILPCGDALADPLTGVAAAASAAEALLGPRAQLIDVSMHDVAREASERSRAPHRTERRDGEWWVETATGRHLVEPPRARQPYR